ncbi:MAG TPA: site-specific DNA-methyltransferase [Chloroflexia bacterium]
MQNITSNKQPGMQLSLDLEPAPSVSDQFALDQPLILLTADVLDACAKLPDSFFSLIITSPPYNIGKSYERQVALDQYLDWQTLVIEQLARLLTPTGSLCWQIGNYVADGEVFPLDIYFYPIFRKLGMKLRNRIVWHFDHGLHASHRFSGRYETLLWFTASDNYTFNLDSVRVPSKYPGKLHYKGAKRGLPSGNPLGKNPSDLWEFMSDEWDTGIWDIPNVKSNHPEKTIHPCQFPVELVERCVLAFTDENDWILDPFAGVGSSLIAAAKNNRRAVGIERDGDYSAFAKQRVADYYAGRLKLRPIGKPIHEPSGREKVAQVPLQWATQQSSENE